nr:hypothetical protein [uncultured Microbacterium sp.]
MEIILWTGILIAVIAVGALILAAALRSMRPQPPAAQVYTPSPAAERSAPATTSITTSLLTDEAIAQIDRLVASGQKIQAIKAYRDSTGVGLREAKDRIEHWSASTTAVSGAAVSHAAAAHTSISLQPSSIRSSLPAGVAAEIDRLLAGNQKIVAIKLLREHTGLGLGESKRFIDSWVSHPQHP